MLFLLVVKAVAIGSSTVVKHAYRLKLLIIVDGHG